MAVPAFVNVANGFNYTGATSLTHATSILPTTAGNHITLVSRGVGVVASVTDTAGNTYVRAGRNTDIGGNLELWHAENVLGHASNVVTVTWTAPASYRDVTAIQHSGVRLSGALVSCVTAVSTPGTTIACTPASTYQAEQVTIVAADINAAGTFTFTPLGFTTRRDGTSVSVASRVDPGRVFDGTVPIVATGGTTGVQKGIIAAVFVGTETLPIPRVSQLPVEVLSQPTPPARVTQFPVELLSAPVPAGRTTQVVVELLGSVSVVVPPPSTSRVTQLAVETLAQSTKADGASVTQLAVETLTATQPRPAQTTQLAVEVFHQRPAPTHATQLAVEVFKQQRPTEAAITQAAIEVYRLKYIPTRATHAAVEVFKAQAAALYTTQVAVEVFLHRPPPTNSCPGELPIDTPPPGGACAAPFTDVDFDEDWT